MLGESELNNLDKQLSDFTAQTKARQGALEQIITAYGKLLGDYRALHSDYEEEKESREKYKKLARGQERNPFVLVLVDGDGYIFEDGLVKAGAEGGVRAASLLNAAVKERLLHLGPEYDDCRIMVRVYANLAGLSKALARAGLTGGEARSLAPFCASFTRAQDLFDFVDAGDKKENADFKIREMFRLFAESGQCKHIFFAGCHDNGYISMLTPYIGRKDRISLVRGSYLGPEFQTLDLNIENFHDLFRNSSLQIHDTHGPVVPKGPTQVNRGNNGYVVSPPTAPVCLHFFRGICKYGNACIKSHATGGGTWRPSRNVPRMDPSLSTPTTGAVNISHSPSTSPPPRPLASTVLPRPSPDTAGLIPLNKAGRRLDFYLQPPASSSWQAYQSRAKVQKLCNDFQLTGHCRNIAKGGCQYDHSSLPDDLKYVLKTIVHDYPCGKKGKCRQEDCHLGHICYNDSCSTSRGKAGSCRLNDIMHAMNPNVARWVPAETATDNGARFEEMSCKAPREDLVSEGSGTEVGCQSPTSSYDENSNNNITTHAPYSSPSYMDEIYILEADGGTSVA